MKTWALSAYLQKQDGNEIQGIPAVGWSHADDREAAIGKFFVSLKEKYKGWSVFDIVIVEIPEFKEPA